jgi:hypothetical protein
MHTNKTAINMQMQTANNQVFSSDGVKKPVWKMLRALSVTCPWRQNVPDTTVSGLPNTEITLHNYSGTHILQGGLLVTEIVIRLSYAYD